MSSTSVKQTTTYLGGSPIRLSEEEVAAYARGVAFGVPVGFVVGMAKRESNWKPNQIDTDYDANGNEKPNKTYGLCQVRRDESLKALSITAIAIEDLCDPETNVRVLCTVLARYRDMLDLAAGSGYSEDDMLRYLAWAHNQGIYAAIKSVNTYGLDWAATRARPQNAYMTGRLFPYAEEILSYCQKYPGAGDEGGNGANVSGYEMGNGSDDSWLRVLFLCAASWIGYKYFYRNRGV